MKPASVMLGLGLRVTFLLHSLIIDKIIYSLAGPQKRYARGVLILWSTSYVSVAYFTQPLIESTLAILVGMSVLLALSAHWSPQRRTETYRWYCARTAIVSWLAVCL